MKVALCQMDLAWLDPSANLRKIKKYLDEAEAQNVEVVIFPEMALTGFCMDEQAACLERESAPVRELIAATRGKRLLAFVGVALKNGSQHTNECLVLRNGELVGSYAKMNLFTPTDEHKHYAAGNRLLTVDHADTRFTPLVCFDSRFWAPIVAGAAAGTDAFIVVASWPEAQSTQWKTLLAARAIDTQSYVIGVNRIGSGGGMDFCGECMVFAPSGKPLFEYSRDERLLVIDVDFTYSRKLKERYPVFTEQYRQARSQAPIPVDTVTVRI